MQLITDNLKPEIVLGLHGTSVEQLVETLRKGKFEQESFSRKYDPIRCDSIHFIANMEYFGDFFHSINVRGSENNDYDGMLKAVKVWSRDIAIRHYIARKIDDRLPQHWELIIRELEKVLEFQKMLHKEPHLDIYDDDLMEWGQEYGQDYLGQMQSAGVDSKEYGKLFLEAYKRQGCIIGFGERCKELRIERGGADYDPEAELFIPEGLSLDYICGIIPLGECEKRILYDLKFG